MNKHINISVLVAFAATTALLIAASTLTPAAFASHHDHGHHSSISVKQSINQENRCSGDCNDNTQVNAAANIAVIGR